MRDVGSSQLWHAYVDKAYDLIQANGLYIHSFT